MKLKSYNHTITACTIGYVAQAVINNFVTLLFVYFIGNYSLTLEKIATISAFNFFVQLCMDMASPYIEKAVGCRATVVGAHFMAGLGLVLMTVLPDKITPYYGLIIASFAYAIGGGLIEVMISPIVESCPTPQNKKAAIMSIMHSFYCWGQLGVIVLSTLFFFVFGIDNWRILALVWAMLPFLNSVYFLFVPIVPPISVKKGMSLKQLILSKTFRVFMIFMVCAGACELAMGQWASAYAEKALGLPKTIGDLAVPCLFALLMGTSRIVNAKLSQKTDPVKYMLFSSVLCLISYLMASLSPVPWIGIIGGTLCGFSVGVMWPGTYSMASRELPNGGLLLFSMLALGGDLGCCAGPALVGYVSELFGGELKRGMLTGVLFSAVLVGAIIVKLRCKKAEE